jgi:P4 family phage/plasmid primase-like protien
VSSAKAEQQRTGPFWEAPELIDAGYRVFPVDSKAPTVEGGFYGATDDKSKVAQWIMDGRGHHDVAVATGVFGGFVALDADTAETFAEMKAKYGPPTYTTKRGGHWLFGHPRNGKVTSNKIASGLDRKGDGGYVIAPPSKGRKWTNGIPEVDSLPMLPREFWSKRSGPASSAGERAIEKDRKDRAAAVIARHIETITPNGSKGGRHEHLVHLCGVLLARDVSLADAEDILKGAWGKVGGDLSERAEREVPNTLATTQAALLEGRATGIPSMEEITPGLYAELAEIMGWIVHISTNGRGSTGEAHAGPLATLRGYNLTDLGNSQRLAAHHGEDLRFCYPWGRWLVWDGRRWSIDNSGEVHRRAKRTVKEIYREAAGAADDETRKALAKHAMRSEAENRIQAMISLAKSEVPVQPEELDSDPWLLNVSNGTLDLRSGDVLEHSREDLITKLAPVEYDHAASAPTWSAVLERAMPSEPVREFFKKLCGRAFSGDVSEHVLPVLYGTGANGKSTILNALLEAAGEYGMQAVPDLLIAKRDNHPTEVADLFGMRFVASIEVEDGRRLAESLVKTLTGGDKVRARKMRQDFWEFAPTHKVFMAVNHKPQVRGNDNAIWRRIRLVPFSETIPPQQQDKKLPEKLRAELPGILRWAVEGCLEWQREGLKAPEEVRRATGKYRSEMDVIGAFLKDCCEEDAEHSVAAKDLYTRYKTWCEENGEAPEKQRTFGSKLSERGYERYRGGASGGHRWRGLTLCKSAICRDSDPTDPQVSIAASKSTRVEENGTSGSDGSDGSVSEEQDRRIRKLVGDGMKEEFARDEVLGKGWVAP